ncbi:MAG TPA: VWA domain-containing protein [Saprospiraceae bacterium]|nr:VWA domain-containing protein [Saprospiraceae bacterium]HMP23804.1 VWA domain-containing protein [Saprospiraceae bacterium]
MPEENVLRWRLILGRHADPAEEVALDKTQSGMDHALELLYNEDRKGGLGNSAPRINRWLKDIRTYFPKPIVQLLQRDALDRLGLKRMLLEPELLETITPDVHLASLLLSLNKTLPEQTRDTARQLVHSIVGQLEQRLHARMRQAIEGSIHRAARSYRPKPHEIDWNQTIRANLKHYQPDYKTVIPERLVGFGRKGAQLRHIILCIDQSGSMSNSVVYAAIFGAILASLRSVRTHLVAFDTEIADLTDLLHDPVDLLFAAQLGGGTDIAKALGYAHSLVHNPQETILVLISDLYEGGSEQALLQKINAIQTSGVQLVTLLALHDEGAPAYNKKVAAHLAQLNIPAFACTPDLFPDLMAAAINKHDLREWLTANNIAVRN